MNSDRQFHEPKVIVLASRPQTTRARPEKRCKICGQLKVVTEFRHDIIGINHCKDICVECEERRWKQTVLRRKARARRNPPENAQ